MADCAAILVEAAKAAGSLQLQWKDRTADPYAAPERLSVADAFTTFAGIDLLATLDGDEGDREKLAAAARAAGVQVADDDNWSDVFSRVLVERIEPRLGFGRPTLLDQYPLPEAAWAQRSADPRLAQRFELYACGVELANGFAEITDAAEQRRRFEDAMAERQRRYGEQYPIDDDFLAALAAMPPSERHRARLRPAGDAGDRSHADRAGAVGAGGRRRPLMRRIDARDWRALGCKINVEGERHVEIPGADRRCRRGDRSCAAVARANLSVAEHHRHRRLPGRRSRRHHRAAGFDQARSPPQAERRGREPRRRRRQHRGQDGLHGARRTATRCWRPPRASPST